MERKDEKMTVEIRISNLDDSPETKHAWEVDSLKAQCENCRLWRPSTPTKDCAVREKLVQKDSEVAWKNKHLFLNPNGKCKMHQPKETRIL